MDVVKAEASRLKAMYNQRKAEAKQAGKTLSQEAVAEMCGWAGQSAVSQYMNARMSLNIEALLKLARALDFELEEVSPRLAKEFMPEKHGAAPRHEHATTDGDPNAMVVAPAYKKIPVIGQASAGRLQEIIERQEIEEWVIAPGPVSDEAFSLRIEGISMEPKFMDGDQVIIDPALDWGLGDYVFARRETDNHGTFKQLKREGDELLLCALNPSYQPRYIAIDDEWCVVGKARWKLEDL
ncbi:XRE family transcriptional regulator [Chromohalobacter israelensis]|uniref:XRE family transcriptional regulator n=1 Tax=Chromohalobacter israelensis TaxID=141390 RepID=UPI00265B75B0|nr:XRE family transcriptional regulator [Chromohalobacter salexigens]MDO0945938.1 XRE family transcriptional regulator [Chromohalobacter salexigens]